MMRMLNPIPDRFMKAEPAPEMSTPPPVYNASGPSYQGDCEGGPRNGEFLTSGHLTIVLHVASGSHNYLASDDELNPGRYDFDPFNSSPTPGEVAGIVKGTWKWVEYSTPEGCPYRDLCRTAQAAGTICGVLLGPGAAPSLLSKHNPAPEYRPGRHRSERIADRNATKYHNAPLSKVSSACMEIDRGGRPDPDRPLYRRKA